MSNLTMEAMGLMDMLPHEEQSRVFVYIKKLVRAWDPDYTKLTPSEKQALDEVVAEDEYIPHEAINWD